MLYPIANVLKVARHAICISYDLKAASQLKTGKGGMHNPVFCNHRLTPCGIKQDPKKIEAIIQMDPPQNVASLQSFNGMVNYLKRFSPVLSELSEPLRRL